MRRRDISRSLATQHIWYIGDASRPWHKDRYKGYARAMAELGLEPHAHTIALSDDEFENGQMAVSYILEQLARDGDPGGLR